MQSLVYYNENNPEAVAWLKELIKKKSIPNGYVDSRSIRDIQPKDLSGFTQCHFFAGIGGWPLALQLAQWPEDAEIWTGSCPCQPYSMAGKQRGFSDDRDLWPVWQKLIEEQRPFTCVGEQVAAAIKFGWLDRVYTDMEATGYTCGAAVLGAHSVGAPHMRQRLYWGAIGLDDSNSEGLQKREMFRKIQETMPAQSELVTTSCMENTPLSKISRFRQEHEYIFGERTKQRFITCKDGRKRRIPTEPALYPLADGLPGRVGLLRGAGNAIVPQVAAAFLRALMEIIN